MYFSKCTFFRSYLLKMYFSKCISQNDFLKMYFSKYIFCLFITLIKCLKSNKSLGLFFNAKNQKLSQSVSDWVSDHWSVSDKATYRAVCVQLKSLPPVSTDRHHSWHTGDPHTQGNAHQSEQKDFKGESKKNTECWLLPWSHAQRGSSCLGPHWRLPCFLQFVPSPFCCYSSL